MANNVVSATVTVTDHTQKARSIYDLLANGSGNGYTVVGGMTGDITDFGMVSYRSIQIDSGSGSVYIGDAGIANDGTRQGITLSSSGLTGWDRDNESDCASLQNLFVRVSADNTAFNVLVERS